MRNKIGKKGWCFAIILLFVGASVVPSVVGNNYSGMDLISAKYTQNNANEEVEYVVLSVGDTKAWHGFGPIGNGVNATCYPDYHKTVNLSQPTTLYLMVLLDTALDLEKDFIFPRSAFFALEVHINGDMVAQDVARLRGTDAGSYRDALCTATPIYIDSDETLEIRIEVGVWLYLWYYQPFGPWQEYCTCNVNLHVQVP